MPASGLCELQKLGRHPGWCRQSHGEPVALHFFQLNGPKHSTRRASWASVLTTQRRWGVRFLRALLQFACFVSFLAVLSGSAWAQTKASLRGTVTDQSGGVIPGAKATLTNTDTGIARGTTTAADGSYFFDFVQVGKYRLTVDKPGFETFIQDGIILELNQNGHQD